jgi:phosphocarrier protein HPr
LKIVSENLPQLQEFIRKRQRYLSDNRKGGVRMKEFTIRITNETGLHARPAAQVVILAAQFKSKIYALKDGKRTDLKSLLDLLSLGICQNDQITIRAEGKDENRAVESITMLLNELNQQ